MRTPELEHAVRYLSHGWNVLPVKPEEKRPIMTNWLQYEHTRVDKQQLEAWFTNLTNVGVGMVTGRISNLVVIDVEVECPYPIADILAKYPTSLVSRSGRGGFHLYYQYPTTVGRVSNRVRIFDGIDIRGDGGFIVLPPTKHPNGSRYEWVSEGPMGVFPMELLDIQSQKPTMTEGWITDALRGVSQGGRNDTCARLAGYFFNKGVSADIVEALLLDWNERNDPPMPISEVRTTLKSIERNHAMRSQQFTSVEFTDDLAATPGAVKTKQQGGAFDLMKMNDYVAGYGGGGITWAVEDWLPDKSVTFVVAPPESYKTWLLIDLIVSIASGKPFLGSHAVNLPGPAMIIQQEDSHGGMAERMALIANAKVGMQPCLNENGYEFPTDPDLPIYVHPSRMLRFDNKAVLQELEKQIEAIRPRVVVIDPLYSTTSVDNYMAASAEQMMILKTWRDKYGCSFIIAHHSKKNVDPDSTAREDSWGSQFLNAFLEAGWQIRRSQKLADNEVVVRRHSKVLGNQPPIMLSFDISTKYPFKYAVSTKMYTPTGIQRNAPAQSDVYCMLTAAPKTQAEIAKETGKSRSVISRQMKQLEASGSVEKMPDGRYRVKDDQ